MVKVCRTVFYLGYQCRNGFQEEAAMRGCDDMQEALFTEAMVEASLRYGYGWLYSRHGDFVNVPNFRCPAGGYMACGDVPAGRFTSDLKSNVRPPSRR